MPRYTKKTLLLALLLTLVVAGWNWLTNPWLMFKAPVIDGLNSIVTENYYRQLIFKPAQLRIIAPRSIVLGASQSGVAFNPDLLPAPSYNLAVGGSTAYIHYRLLQEAISQNPSLDTVILELPFFAFNSSDPNNRPNHDHELENRLSSQYDNKRNLHLYESRIQESLSALLSWDSLRASLRMVSKQDSVRKGKRGSFIQLRNGQWQQQLPPGTSTAALIEGSWKKSVFNDWLPAPCHCYTLPNQNENSFRYYHDSLRLLHENHIKTHIVIAPMHASLLVALQETGLWQQFQQWKRELVAINAATAREMDTAAFGLTDYAAVTPLTTETLPTGNSTNRLTWFNDSMHPSTRFGDLIMDELLSGNVVQGRNLDPANIDTTLEADNNALTSYIALHPGQQAAIRTLLANPPAKKP